MTGCISLTLGSKDGKLSMGVDLQYDQMLNWGKEKWDDHQDKEKVDEAKEETMQDDREG